jgi:hypothetical protein
LCASLGASRFSDRSPNRKWRSSLLRRVGPRTSEATRWSSRVGDESNYDQRFLELSRAIEKRFDQWVAHLQTFPPKEKTEPEEEDNATDAAMNVRGVETRSAYYFGLALGLRLAGGTR